jgi:hypothetical protein
MPVKTRVRGQEIREGFWPGCGTGLPPLAFLCLCFTFSATGQEKPASLPPAQPSPAASVQSPAKTAAQPPDSSKEALFM